jgi:hypothetical protein
MTNQIRDMQLLRYAVASYSSLPGLRMTPYGFYILVWTVLAKQLLPVPDWLAQLAQATSGLWLVPIFAVVYILVHRYYQRAFGRVSPLVRSSRRFWLTLLGMGLALMTAIFVDKNLRLPVMTFGLTLSAIVFVSLWPKRPYSLHYLVMAGVVAGISLLPLWGVFQPDQYATVGLLGLGTICLLGGIIDHLLLLKAFEMSRRMSRYEAV